MKKTNRAARRAILALTASLALATFYSPGEPVHRLFPALSPVVNVLSNGLAWQIRPSLLTGGNGWEAGALVGLLENAAGNPADIVTGDPTSLGFSAYGKLSVEVVSGAQGVFPYAPVGPAEYDPLRREVVFPSMAAAGLRVSRTVRVSEDGTACAWLNAFVNETSQPMTIWATLTSDLDSLAPAEWVMTSSGDAAPDLRDEWLASQSRGGSQAVGHILGHVGTRAFLVAVRTAPVGSGTSNGDASSSTSFTYQIQLDPGQSGSLACIAFLEKTVGEAVERAALFDEDTATRYLLSPWVARQAFNFDERRLTSLRWCYAGRPGFWEPGRNSVVEGLFPCRVRVPAEPMPVRLEIFGRYKGIDATGNIIIWSDPRQLDDYAFVTRVSFMDEEGDFVSERSVTLDTRRFSGGIDGGRKLEAKYWSKCYFYSPPEMEQGETLIIDGNPCQTHVDIISPSSGTLLDRPVNLAIQPYCPGSASLEFSLDESVLFTQIVQKPAGRLAPPRMYFLLDPATIKAGTKTLRVKISDSAGCSESKDITLVIPNQPPALEVTAPNDDAVVGGPVSIQFRATDDRRLDHIEVFVDGAPGARTDLSGISVNSSLDWDSCAGPNGRHSVQVVLTDWDDATAQRSMTVDVRNVLIDLTATRRQAQQRSLVELRFQYQNPGPSLISGFAVWRKAEGGEFVRVSTIPLASAAAGTGTWVDMPGKAGSFSYKIEALDAGGRIIGRSQEAGL